MTGKTVTSERSLGSTPLSAGGLAGLGGLIGLAWASGLRGLMAEIAGPSSTVEWHGTFIGVLLPGVVAGSLLGWAEHLRRIGGRPGWRWLALAPLAFPVAVFTEPGQLTALLEQALGGGALAVATIGMLGGYALSGRGPPWGRVLAGVVVLMSIPAWIAMAPDVGGPGLAVTTSRGAWVAVFYFSFLAVLAVGSAIPHRSPELAATDPVPDTYAT